MKLKIIRVNIFLSTLNFVLCFVGYPLVTTILLPSTSDLENISRIVTVPYRAFALLISLLVIIINSRRNLSPLPIALKGVIFYWVILIVRIIYDVNFGIFTSSKEFTDLWFYVFGICLPAFISIIKSYERIDLDLAFYAILGLASLTLVASIFTNQSIWETDGLEKRQDGNIAFNTISFGHLGATTFILGFYTLLKKNINYFNKIVVLLIMSLGIFCLLRSGSRGPVLTLVVILSNWQFSYSKGFWNVLIMVVFGLSAIVFFDQILELIGYVAPVMEDRLKSTIYEHDLNDRDSVSEKAFDAFLDSPFWGKQFALRDDDGSFYYSHNILLDALMGLGFIGGSVFIYLIGESFRVSYFLIRNNDAHFWIGLVLLQQIISSFTSGSFYYNQVLSVLLAFNFLYYYKYKHVNFR